MSGPQDLGHSGAYTHGAFTQEADPRVAAALRSAELNNPLQRFGRPLADPQSAVQHGLHSFSRDNPLQLGTVVHSLGFFNWYKVQLGKAGSTIPCCMLSESSFLPVGVRSTSPIPANSWVLVYVPPNKNVGIILGAIPFEIYDGEVNNFQWLVQGGNSGVKREKAHRYLWQLYKGGGVRDYSCGRPLDTTMLEKGWISETGVAIMLDAYQAFMRVNEACGLFLNYWDSYTRLAGINLDIHTYPWQVETREDEGECLHIVRGCIYPWEALGLYKPGEEFTQEYDDKDVHYNKCTAKVDLKDGMADLDPIARYQEFGGYLGQGHMRQVMVPSKDSGTRKLSDTDLDYGVFREAISLDGTYMLSAAKGIYLSKRVLIPSPRRTAAPESGNGDDAEKNNYMFSGMTGFGGGEHNIKDIQTEGDAQHMQRVAGVLDLLAYHYNWKAVHPFHYHENDWDLPQESDSEKFERNMDQLEYSQLASKDFLPYPTAKKLKVDHRYGEVSYYQRESFIVMHDDGSVQIGDGYGSQIVLSAGQVRIEAPGDVQVLPGKRFVALGWDVILRAKNSMDFSATEKDMRFKAEKNMQFLSGNGKTGGMLFECKSQGTTQQYDGKYGEDVRSSGIVFLCKKGEIAALGKAIYLRTGSGNGEISDGPITIDASRGNKDLTLYGKKINVFANKDVSIFHSPQDESANIDANHRFSKNTCILSGNLIVEKNVVIADGNIAVKKGIICQGSLAVEKSFQLGKDLFAGGNIIAKKKMAHKGGFFVGDSSQMPSPEFGDTNKFFTQAKEAKDKHKDTGEPMFDASVADRWYDENKLGNETTIKSLAFSFRDPPSGDQYKVGSFKFAESRWQTLLRLGGATGEAKTWTEKAVTVSGTETYPWPGKKKWKEESVFLQIGSMSLYDVSAGRDKDRPGPYEEAKLGTLNPTTMESGFKMIL